MSHRPMLRFLSRYVLCLLLFNLAAWSSYQSVTIERAMYQTRPSGVAFGGLV